MRRIFGLLALLSAGYVEEARAQASAPPAPKPSTTTSSTTVQGLTVTAERPTAQTLLDRKVYTITSDLQATSGTAADVLNQVPSVAVDPDGGLTLRGDANVTILVDGKPSAQFSGASAGLSLLQFPANEIERIEVFTSPPAQFKAEGSGGVINIVTRKSRRAGLSGSARLSLGDKRRYVAGLDGSYNKGPLKLSGGIGLRQDAKERITTDARTATDPTSGDVVQSGQSIDEHFRRLIPSVKADLEYGLDPSQTFGASYSHRELTGVRFFNQHDFDGPPGGSLADISDRHSDGHEWSVDGSEGLSFEQKLARPGETLNLGLQRSVTRERERYAYRNTFTLPAGPPTFDDLHLSLDLVKTELSADYDLPLSGQRELKLGYDLEDDRNAFDNVGDLDPVGGAPVIELGVTNHFRYRQQVNAAYAQFEAPFGPWRLQAGLRAEATHVSTLQITGDIKGGRNDAAVYPSLHLDRAFGDDTKVSLGVARRVTRPNPESLNPFTDFQDTHNLRAGNADLLPQDTWIYEAGFTQSMSSVTFGAQAYYRFDRNSVTDVIKPVSADVVLDTKENLPKSRSEGLEFNANGKLGGKLSFNLSGELFLAQIDAGALGLAGLRSTSGVNLKGGLDFRPTPADTAQVSVSRQDRRLTPQGSIDPIDQVNLGYRRQLRPDLSFVVTVSDALDGQRQRRVVDSPVLHDVYVRHQLGRIAYAGFVYTFGGAGKKAQGFDYEP